jgi:hypothetical protein
MGDAGINIALSDKLGMFFSSYFFFNKAQKYKIL